MRAIAVVLGLLSVAACRAGGDDEDGPIGDVHVAVEGDGGGGPVEVPEIAGCQGCPFGSCIQREKDDEPLCPEACGQDGACPVGLICLGFPDGGRCLPSGQRGAGLPCTKPSDCAGALCVWSGKGASLCTNQCDGPNDLTHCGEGRSCLPSLSRDGFYDCYPTGGLQMGDDCLAREHECQGAYCIGQGLAAYCTRFCRPGDAVADCPDGWGCAGHEGGHLCCWAERAGDFGCAQ